MKCRLLGPIELADTGTVLELGPPKQRALLAVLASSPRRVVSTDRLIDALWGDEPPPSAAHAVQTYVSGLRKALGPNSSQLETKPPGYRLLIDDCDIDSLRFEQLGNTGEQQLRSGNAEAASAAFDEALEMWRGPPLDDVSDQPFAALEVHRLNELHVRILELWAEAELELGNHRAILPRLQEVARQHPLREPLWSHLMLALYRSERQADALRAYRELRTTLGEELGIEPSHAVRRLEEQILLQDPSLLRAQAELAADAAAEPRNPYRGLRAFREEHAADYYGREALVDRLCDVIPTRELVAIVGPSGCGKSSLVRAGLIPALRSEAKSAPDRWTIATMVPGHHPIDELDAALRRASDAIEPVSRDAVGSIHEIAAQLLSVASGGNPFLLVIDQFEDLFAAAIDEDVRRRFLDGLVAALDDPHRRVHVLVTLRADYYDRPLLYPSFGSRFASGVVNVMPMNAEELEAAAVEPARAVGMTVEPALLATLIADASNQPGSLPLFEYALTELFEAASDRRLTIDHYQQIGGIRGALTRRADALYAPLTPQQQEAARQIFLRLVAVDDPGGSSLRRVRARELADLDIDSVVTQTVIELYGAHRLLSFDRDPLSGDPVIAVAHEALLREWTRLRTWVDDHREDLRRRASLSVYARDWTTATRDPDYLLSGTRLERYERWATSAGLALTSAERAFLEASAALRDTLAEEEAERAARLERLEHRAREPGYVLGPSAPHVPFWPWPARLSQLRPPPARVALMSEGRGDLAWNDQIASGLNRAVRHFGIQAIEVAPVVDPEGEARGLAETGFDLIFIPGLYIDAMNVACDYPETIFACIDYSAWAISPDHIELPNVVGLDFASEEGSFLVGAAAAMTTQTGKLGFVGGMDIPVISQFEAGYVAGARTVDETVEVMVTFVSDSGAWEAFSRPDLGRLACRALFERGADVVFAAAGKSGEGGLDAAAGASPSDDHRWIIGADVDRHDALPRAVRAHLLTTMLKRTDVAVHQTTESLLEGSLQGGLHVLGLAESGVGYSTSGDYLEPLVPRLAAMRQAIVAGDITVPRTPGPSRFVLPGPTVAAVTDLVTLEFDGRRCRYDGAVRFAQDAVLRIAATNEQDHPTWVVVARIPDDNPRFDSTPISVATMPGYILDDTAIVAEIEPGAAQMTVPLDRGRYLLACLTLLDEPAMVFPAAELHSVPNG